MCRNAPKCAAHLANRHQVKLDEQINMLRSLDSDTTAVEAKAAAGGLPASLTPTLSAFASMPGGGLVILGPHAASGVRATAVADDGALAAERERMSTILLVP